MGKIDKISISKVDSVAKLGELIEKFTKDFNAFKSVAYNETQLRIDFINPFLKILGWDVDNESAKSQFVRDVVQEEPLAVEDENSKKNPDYTLRVLGQRKLFIEAKKPSVEISKSVSSAFQIKRYGWNAKLRISVLTNFEHLIVYDCGFKPSAGQHFSIGRVEIFHYEEYVNRFDEIYDLISFDSCTLGKDESSEKLTVTGQSFDEYFLQQIEKWRTEIAFSAINRNPKLNQEDINFLAQRLLNRIIFLRICEDRTIEKYETLRAIKTYEELKALFLQSDQKYNSGLFDFIEDNLSLNIEIDAEVFLSIFNELYYPLSPYDFAVVDPAILSQIYEQFLGRQVEMGLDRSFSMTMIPEVVASNGVVPTPKYIVDQIIKDTLDPLIVSCSVEELSKLRIADICCGSGTFLIGIYDFLLRETIERQIMDPDTHSKSLKTLSNGSYDLTLAAKQQILQNNIFGVDINPYAVEVAQFSLLLKLLEGESNYTIAQYSIENDNKILPNLRQNIKTGNSIVNSDFYKFDLRSLDEDSILFKVRPFQWQKEFHFIGESGGFDAIVGNPPYVRIQHLQKYAAEEIKFYQSKNSGYRVSGNKAIDKYYLFIERAISLLNPSGLLGYIVPHKFFINTTGYDLRLVITDQMSIAKIIHFGVAQVFPGRSTYTAIVILSKFSHKYFTVRRVKGTSKASLLRKEAEVQYTNNDFGANPWVFLSKETAAVFEKIRLGNKVTLSGLADISVGVQTSADKIYIFKADSHSEHTYTFSANGRNWEIEKDIARPCIYDLSFSAFDTIVANAYMIFPYKIIDGKAIVISEEEMAKEYPLCMAYLNEHKPQLSKRNVNGKDPIWYQFGRSQSLTKFFEADKLIWPVLSKEPSYVLDQADILFTGGGNGPYYSLINTSDYSIYYIMGILCHPIFERMVKAGASEFRGAYYSHGKQFLKNIPVKEIDVENKNEVDLYDGLVSVVKKLISSKISYAESYGSKKEVLGRKIEELFQVMVATVNTLYGISTEEYNVVMNDETFDNELIENEE